MILTDNETKVDLLNNEAIASTINSLLRARPDRPVTIGVHGDWGAGKSSVLEMIEAGLDGVDGVLCVKFNGWRFQGFEDAKIALIEGIVTALIEKRPMLNKAGGVVKEVFRRIDWLKVAKKAGGLALTAFTGVPTPDQVQAALGALTRVLSDPAKLATKENVVAAVETAKSLLKDDVETRNVPEEIGEFRKAFDDLLKEAGIEQLIVLIDDLDRCLPDTAIETLEAVRLFVFTSRTAFVVAADEAMIEYAVRKHFPDLPDTTGPRDYARNYLEKLIQVPFRIPALGETETRVYVTLLLIGAELGDEDEGYANLIAVARERLKRPWESAALDAATVNASLGANAARAQNALNLSDQVGSILAAGTKGNPRQIKRFLNTLLLRHRTAEARGFGEEVKLQVLAKLMLAERFLPRLFDQIATVAAAHPKGRCEDLGRLEAAAGQTSASAGATDEAEDESAFVPAGPRATAKPEARGVKETLEDGSRGKGRASKETAAASISKPAESTMLTEWLGSNAIHDWARVQPALGEVDLRPYLFVTKDRKDYFGPASALGHLASVVEQLLGPKLSVQALMGDLKKLAPAEAAQVFEAIRTRIMGAGAFDTEPPGVAGLAVLVRAHPSLQPSLLDFLAGLPREQLGAWAVTGWEGVIQEADASARFAQLLDAWSGAEKNPFLKAAAGGALRMRKGGR